MINTTAAKAGVIYLYAPIEVGDSMAFAVALQSVEGDTLTMRINSPGGLVSEGVAIFNLAVTSGKKVMVYIDGMAGSIASVIAMAGDEVRIAENAAMFVHNPLNMRGGNAEELRKYADELDSMTPGLVAAYMRRAKDEAKIRELMAAETFLSATEAVELGLADTVVSISPVAALHAAAYPKLSERLLKHAAKLSAPTAGKDTKNQPAKTMADQMPADQSATIAELRETVASLAKTVDALTARLDAQASKEPDAVVALRKELDEIKARPAAVAIKPGAPAAKSAEETRREYHAETNPMKRAQIYAQNRSAF